MYEVLTNRDFFSDRDLDLTLTHYLLVMFLLRLYFVFITIESP